ncbi:MAG: hemerythrin domain-containing protein [Bdellovibrionota bacterium]
MTILDLIKEDHDGAMEIIKRLEKMTEKPSKRAWDLTKELVEEVLLHAKTEEKVLYSAMKAKNISFRDFTLEGEIEHKLLESCLMGLLKVRPGEDGKYKAALSVVKELLEHHGKEEEEKELFPKLRKSYKRAELEEMGVEFKAMKKEIRPKIMLKLSGPRLKGASVNSAKQILH